MTSDVDYNLHEVDGPREISRHTPLSDQKNRRKRQSPPRKQRHRKKTGDADAKRPIAGEVDRDTDIPDSGDSTQKDRDDHEVDYYA